MTTTGEYTVQGVVISALAKEFGTPLYVYDGDVLGRTYRELRAQLHPGVDILYSAKANPNISVCGLLGSLGAGAEVSSLVELVTARRAGVSNRDIIFLGPAKSADELRSCVDGGVHAVVCESFAELDAVEEMSGPAGTNVLLRVNPSFVATGARLSMGGKPRQFGIDEAIVRGAGKYLGSLRRARITGVHAYMGTRILDAAAIVHNTEAILEMAEKLSAEVGFPLYTVDVGGGFGVPYFEREEPLDVAAATAGINAAVEDFRRRNPDCRIIIELGRYLAGWCGTYVVRARYVKESMGEWFVVADGGTNHHMAAVGIGSFVKRNFPIRSLSRPGEPACRQYTVTGPLCTPNDVVAKQVALPDVRPGDLLGIERSGAYGPTASPVLFLSHGAPAEVLVLDGTPHLVRQRDTVEDLLAKQHLISL